MADSGVRKQAFAAAIFKRGQKEELFNAGAEGGAAASEEAELAAKLGDLHAVWSLPRSGRDLAAAIWRPALGAAEVVLQRGRILEKMGWQRGSKLFLHPEEALYLADRANLLLFLDAAPGAEKRLLSLQEAHDLLAGGGTALARYLVFAKLLRAGYVVQRHPARWALGAGEDPAQVWGAWGRDPPGPLDQQQQQQQQQQQDVGQPAGAQPQQPQQPPQQQPPSTAALPAGPPSKRRRTAAQQPEQRSTQWWAAPEAPPPPAGEAGEAGGVPAAAGPTLGLPWLAGCLPAGFVDSLPRCQVLPDAQQRARADFPRMAPLASLPLSELLPLGGGGPSAGRHLLHYDVYAPSARFSRKAPGPPTYTVCVLPCTRLPSPEDCAAADGAAGGVPVRWATIEKGDICFYGLAHVELRSILQ